jgi:hypothetical protein
MHPPEEAAVATEERRQSAPLDQISLALQSLVEPAERAQFLLDPDRYAARRKVALDPGFVEAIQREAAAINRRFVEAENELGISVPSINDPRLDIAFRPGEVAILPALAAAAAVVEAAALVVIAVTEVYQATKFVARA